MKDDEDQKPTDHVQATTDHASESLTVVMDQSQINETIEATNTVELEDLSAHLDKMDEATVSKEEAAPFTEELEHAAADDKLASSSSTLLVTVTPRKSARRSPRLILPRPSSRLADEALSQNQSPVLQRQVTPAKKNKSRSTRRKSSVEKSQGKGRRKSLPSSSVAPQLDILNKTDSLLKKESPVKKLVMSEDVQAALSTHLDKIVDNNVADVDPVNDAVPVLERSATEEAELANALGSIGADSSAAEDDDDEEKMHTPADNIYPGMSQSLIQEVSKLPSGLHIASKKSSSFSKSDPSQGFAVVSSHHPELTTPMVTIEKVSRKKSSALQNFSMKSIVETPASTHASSVQISYISSQPQDTSYQNTQITTDLSFSQSAHQYHQPQHWQHSSQLDQQRLLTNPSLYQVPVQSNYNETSFNHVNIKPEPQSDVSHLRTSHQTQQSSMELEEYINNDDFNHMVSKVVAAPGDAAPIKEEISEQDNDNKMYVESQLASGGYGPGVHYPPGSYTGQFYSSSYYPAVEPGKVITMFPPGMMSDSSVPSINTVQTNYSSTAAFTSTSDYSSMTPVPTNSSVISQPIAPSSSSSLLPQQSEPSQSEKIFTLTQQQVNKFRNICAGVFRNEMSIKEAAYFSGYHLF